MSYTQLGEGINYVPHIGAYLALTSTPTTIVKLVFDDSENPQGTLTPGTPEGGGTNIGIGVDVFGSLTSGYGNTAIAHQALTANTTGSRNTAFGSKSLVFNTTGYNNTALGGGAMYNNTTGWNCVAIGTDALATQTTGDSNTVVGVDAFEQNTTGEYHAGIGVGVFQSNTTGTKNTGVGGYAGTNNTTGSENTMLGCDAGFAPNGNTANATTTASGQTLVGYETGQGSATQVNYITCLGLSATAAGSGGVAIGADHTGVGAASTNEDQIVLGTPLHSTCLGTTAPATTATTGFPYMPAMAGAPTGIPTAQTGWCPFVYDTTDNELWIYNGSWKSVALA